MRNFPEAETVASAANVHHKAMGNFGGLQYSTALVKECRDVTYGKNN